MGPDYFQHKLSNSKVGVIGAGKTGLAVAHYLSKHGISVFLSEKSSLEEKEKLKRWGVAYEEGGHSHRLLENDLIVLSPGIPLSIPVIEEINKLEIPVIGEIELAYRLCKSDKIIGVTGTNGKTTTTRLIGEILRVNGYEVVVCGNIGNPFIGELDNIDEDTIVVLEVSSYQLETIHEFHPWIALLLNLAPDHLSRHGSIQNYYRIKYRVFENQTLDEWLIVNRDIDLPADLRPQVIIYNNIKLNLANLKGIRRHNLNNLKAALASARIIDHHIDLSSIDINKTLSLPHRIEFVTEIEGLKFYNDSKATNTSATEAAIKSFSEPITLILGGKDKGENYASLSAVIKEKKVTKVFLIGESATRIAQSLNQAGYYRYVYVKDFFQTAKLTLKEGAKVCLFSPACSSFDQFENYKERGKAFKKAVTAMFQ